MQNLRISKFNNQDEYNNALNNIQSLQIIADKLQIQLKQQQLNSKYSSPVTQPKNQVEGQGIFQDCLDNQNNVGSQNKAKESNYTTSEQVKNSYSNNLQNQDSEMMLMQNINYKEHQK